MSGETEASVSGWTVDTLREHITAAIVPGPAPHAPIISGEPR